MFGSQLKDEDDEDGLKEPAAEDESEEDGRMHVDIQDHSMSLLEEGWDRARHF